MTTADPVPDPDSRPWPAADVVRVLAFIVCGLLVSVKADGRFPLPESLSEGAFQLLLLPYTLALVGAVTAFLAADRLAAPLARALPASLLRVSPAAWAFAGVAGFELLTLVVLRSAARKYAAFGYVMPTSVLLGVALSVGVALVLATWRRPAEGVQLFGVAGSIYLSSQILSLVYFPLHSGRSDMLPLIASAARRLLSGLSPYGLHELPHSVPLTYLPGTWLPFVPAVALGLDPRVVHFLTTLAAVALLVLAAPRERRGVTGALGALFLTLPYLQYRHEIYLGPLWLALALVVWLETRGPSRWLGLAVGWAAAASQFVWVILPVCALHLVRRSGARSTLRVAVLASATVVVLVGPFVAAAPQAFVQGVFGHWERTLNVTTANLSYAVARLVSFEGLRLVQAAAWLLMLGAAWRWQRRVDAPWAAMAAVLGVFVLLNSVVWVYFYLTVFFLMLASVAVDQRRSRVSPRAENESEG